MVLQAHDHTPWLFGQAPVFSQRYRFLTYDRRGTGRSSSPPGDWTAADLANDLAAFLDALGIDKAIVGGSSLGGVVTAQFAVDHPGRALALVIGHTVPYLDDEGRAWLEGEVATARAGRPAIVRQPRSGKDAEGPPTTDPVFAASPWGKLMAATGTGLGRTPDDRVRAIAVLRDWDQRTRKADLAKIDVPTLVIVGEHEPPSTIEGCAEWASWIPVPNFVVLRRASRRAARGGARVERRGAGFPRPARPGWTIDQVTGTSAARAVPVVSPRGHQARVPCLAPGSRVPHDPEQPRSRGRREARRAHRLRRHRPRRALVAGVRPHPRDASPPQERRDAARAVGQAGRRLPHARVGAARAHLERDARAEVGDVGGVPRARGRWG